MRDALEVKDLPGWLMFLSEIGYCDLVGLPLYGQTDLDEEGHFSTFFFCPKGN